tara:strand:- start:149 stop:568 length:420 start_codon:yes stop_codon:yes gene_type:complete
MEISDEVGSFAIIALVLFGAFVKFVEMSIDNKRHADFKEGRKRHREVMSSLTNTFVQHELHVAKDNAFRAAKLQYFKEEMVEDTGEPSIASTSVAVVNECVSLLVSLGHRKSDAKKKVNSLSGHKFDTTEEMLTAALSR